MRKPSISRTKSKSGSCPLNRLEKYGFIAIVFFTIKGLLWLLVPALIAVSL